MPDANPDAANESSQTDVQADKTAAAASLSDDGQLAAIQAGMQAYAQKDYNAAVAQLESGLSGQTNQWKPMVCLGLSCYALKRYAQAEGVFSRIVDECPDKEMVGRATQALDKVRAAIASLEAQGDTQGQESQSEGGQAPAPKAERVIRTDLPPDEREKHIKWGTNSYLSGKYDKAIEYLESGLYGDEEHWSARLALGMSYHKVGESSKGMEVISTIRDNCTDQKLVQRAKQALDSIKFENTKQTTAERKAYDAQMEMDALEKAERLQRRKEQAQVQVQSERVAAAEVRESRFTLPPTAQQGQRKTHPLVLVALALSIAGIGYSMSVGYVPGAYQTLALKDPSTFNRTVSSFAVLQGIQPKEVQIPAGGGAKLTGEIYDKPGATKFVIIHSATFDDWAMRRELADALLQAGFSVLVYDAKGHGRSTGKASWDGIVDDGLFAYDFLHGQLGVKGDAIASYGASMASATAAGTGAMREHYAVVLENPFTSMPQLARDKLPWLGIIPDSFCPEPQYKFMQDAKTHAPVLVLISQDPIVPAAESQAFFAKLGGVKDTKTVSSPVTSKHWDEVIRFLQK